MTPTELLVDLMMHISEECYCAGWLIDLEYDLWEIMHEGADRNYGMGRVTEEQTARLLELANECDGWVIWDEGPLYVSASKWRRLLDMKKGQEVGTKTEKTA